MPASVVDASVIAAYAFAEPRAHEARALLAGVEMYAPTLLTYELSSIARTKVVRYPEQRGSILDALEIALALDIRWIPIAPLSVVRLALDTGLSTYDASYLHIARRLEIPVLTFDNRLRDVIARTDSPN